MLNPNQTIRRRIIHWKALRPDIRIELPPFDQIPDTDRSEGLPASVMQLVRRSQPPEHIVIETSSVSDPIEVARTFGDPDPQPYAPLEGIVTDVDAELAPTLDSKMLQLARHQVLAADVAVLNFIGSHGGVDGNWPEAKLTDRAEWLT